MKNLLLVVAAASLAFAQSDGARWEKQARAITITRDDWGIAHVHGKTDADAVFGMIYAQAEDDFNRVETNYLTFLGRTAEAEGQAKIIQDLRAQLFADPVELKKTYASCPEWLKKLMVAWADGLNFYLYKHPDVHPKVITHFEPWMTLAFSEGSIGGDTERVNLRELESFYGGSAQTGAVNDDGDIEQEPGGSNGIAVGPSDTRDHHAMMLINPHTSFFFRSELQMSSDEGLDAYGAVTWGQFFIYQGFNDRAGWMHTSSGVDAIDEYLETVSKRDGHYFYKYGSEERPLRSREITIRYKTDNGLAEKKFTVYYSHHGPIVSELNGKWVAFRIMQKPVEALEQSFLRTKARDYKSYRQTMELKANSSNNTIFADADGDIAYFHGNFIPRRDTKFDWTKPVDGSNPETEWKGLLSIDETPHLLNPHTGWLFNVNDSPWNSAGPDSPKREDYPKYVENGGESARGLHALRILENQHDFTLDSFLAAAFDSYLPWFAKTIPALLKAYDGAPAPDPLKSKLADQIAILRDWNYRWSADSVATSLAVFWGEAVRRGGGRGMQQDQVAALPAERLLLALDSASQKLASDFGAWKTPWGEINRFQRINDDIVSNFNDAGPSIAVPFTSSQWGSLASFGARQYPNTKKWYGTSGNSFVAVVEFGPRVRARAVTAGGESGHPGSRHFNDEAERYASGNLRDVYFYPDQLKSHTERQYHPGE